MTAHDYLGGRRIEQVVAQEGLSFYAIIQAAMRQADTRNLDALRRAFPEQWDDLQKRYSHARSSDGLMPEEVRASERH